MVSTAIIELTIEERKIVDKIIEDETSDPNTLLRAKILQLSDHANTPLLSVSKIAELTGSSRQTVTKIRNIYCTDGFETALHVLERNRNRYCKMTSDELIANIRQLLNEPPADGQNRWTVRSLCKECIERGYAEYIAPSTLMRILHKYNISLK